MTRKPATGRTGSQSYAGGGFSGGLARVAAGRKARSGRCDPRRLPRFPPGRRSGWPSPSAPGPPPPAARLGDPRRVGLPPAAPGPRPATGALALAPRPAPPVDRRAERRAVAASLLGGPAARPARQVLRRHARGSLARGDQPHSGHGLAPPRCHAFERGGLGGPRRIRGRALSPRQPARRPAAPAGGPTVAGVWVAALYAALAAHRAFVTGARRPGPANGIGGGPWSAPP